MKYKLTINYEYIRDMQEVYNELIEEGYLPDKARQQIEFNLRELAEKIDWCADNTFWGNYTEIVNVEKIDD
jgi:hypothetical protein